MEVSFILNGTYGMPTKKPPSLQRSIRTKKGAEKDHGQRQNAAPKDRVLIS
jgi:hypothetical protein